MQNQSPIKVIDAHCHLDFPWFSAELEQVITRAKASLAAVVTSAVDPRSYPLSIQLSRNHPGFIYTVLGKEPQRVSEFQPGPLLEMIRTYLPDTVALGEIGLDYYWVADPEIRARQRDTLAIYLEFAKRHKLPVVIHSRNAEQDCVDILEASGVEKAYFHCFDGELSLIELIVQHPGWMIGVATNVVYRKKTQEIAKMVPCDHLLIETDSPFLHPTDRKARNEPWNVTFVVDMIAKLTGESVYDLARNTSTNTKTFYNLQF